MKGKLQASQRFHPDNTRLRTTKKMRKLKPDQLEYYLALGTMAAAAYKSSNAAFQLWHVSKGQKRKRLVPAYTWCEIALVNLRRIKQQRIDDAAREARAHHMTLQTDEVWTNLSAYISSHQCQQRRER